MASVNKVILVGTLGQDPELRRTASGAAVTNFSMATSERYTKDGEKVDETEWHNIVAWNKSAETMAQYLNKGSQVYVEGKLKTRSWDDNGVKKYKTEILVDRFQFIGGKSEGQQNNTPQQPPQQQTPPPAGVNEDLPF